MVDVDGEEVELLNKVEGKARMQFLLVSHGIRGDDVSKSESAEVRGGRYRGEVIQEGAIRDDDGGQ